MTSLPSGAGAVSGALEPECVAGPTALGKFIRATDLHSKRITKRGGPTIPQVMVMQAIADLGEVTGRSISDQVSPSPATVTTVLDRLEERGLVERHWSTIDRRIAGAKLTPLGNDALASAPAPLPLLDTRTPQ